MRLRWRWLLLLIVLAGLAGSGAVRSWVGRCWEALASLAPRPAEPDWRDWKVSTSLISTTYVLPREGWLTFDLPPQQPLVRIITNADLPLASRGKFPSPLPDDVKWPYVIQCQLLGRGGRVLVQRDYHHQTRLTEYRDTETAATVLGGFYLGTDLLPADARIALVNLREAPEPVTRVRLRLLEAPEPLSGAVVRISYPLELPAHRVRYGWQHLYEDRRLKLARSNVYAPELLTEQEKENLFEHIWKPMAPAGIPGHDYQPRDFYALKEVTGEELRVPPPPAGSLVDLDRRAVIAVPEEGGKVRFVFEPLDPHATGDVVELHWFGKGLTQRMVYRIPWEGRQTTFEGPMAGGLVEVQASFPLAVRAFLPDGRKSDRKHNPGDAEITPEVMYAWSYFLSEPPGLSAAQQQGVAPVAFGILHAGNEPTPIRIDLRQYMPVSVEHPTSGRPDQAPPVRKVHYQILDGGGRTVQEGDLAVDQPPSVYDRLKLGRQEFLVSEPSSTFFSAPPSAARIRFPATKVPVMVAMYNRPGMLVKATRAPEDYFRFNRDEVAQRSWFPVRALRHEGLEMENRAPLLTLQSRPQVDVPDVQAGVYQWDHFFPQGSWRGRGLLVPRDVTAPFRAEELAATFQELPPGKDTTLEFQAEPGRGELLLTLLYFSEEQRDSFTLRLYVDGRLHYQELVPGPRGEILLPRIALGKDGKRSVRVTSSARARVLLNYVDPGKAPAFIKRLAAVLDQEGLGFDYEKTSLKDELLCARLFRAPGKAAKRTVVRVRLELAPDALTGPHTSWSFRERLYDLAPAPGDPLPVMGTVADTVDPGQDFFFPLGDDLPPGHYRVRMELVEGPGGYVCLSRITPGAYERRDFFIEQPSRRDAVREP
jgi:hypothetical protein